MNRRGHVEAVKAARAIARTVRAGKPVSCAVGSAEAHLMTLDLEITRLRRVAREVVICQLVGEHLGFDGKEISAFHELELQIGMVPRCRRCGCTDARACPPLKVTSPKGGDLGTLPACHWVQVGLCSRCDPR